MTVVRSLFVAAFTATLILTGTSLFAQSKARTSKKTSARTSTSKASGKIADYSSRNYLIHTDAPAEEARDLLNRLETMLTLISRYWGRPPSGIVECWVVKDLAAWPAGTLPEEGRPWVEMGGGVTHTTGISSGNQFVAKSRVYAVADRGTPLHESVHAYCGQAFGRTGPLWYAEGMAEMGQYWREGDSGVQAHSNVIDYLTRAPPKSLNEIVNNREITGDSWENYAWRWALCHLLCNNPNYAPRFRPLGIGLLTGQKNLSFESVYGAMADEITFEYAFFLQHLEKDLRADLIAWDWKARFKKNTTSNATIATVEAARGWQPSKLTVEKDVEYEFASTGSWTLARNGMAVSPDGQQDGGGKLLGAILSKDSSIYELSSPIDLGVSGTFVAPADGDLYLRCQDGWSALADNKGKVSVRIKMKGKGTPLVEGNVQEKPRSE